MVFDHDKNKLTVKTGWDLGIPSLKSTVACFFTSHENILF